LNTRADASKQVRSGQTNEMRAGLLILVGKNAE
jgi:hypothetical protein